jgi:hypothetical protein
MYTGQDFMCFKSTEKNLNETYEQIAWHRHIYNNLNSFQFRDGNFAGKELALMTYLLCRELCVILKNCKMKSRDVGVNSGYAEKT